MRNDEGAVKAALSSFGMAKASVEPLSGGLLNRVFRVRTQRSSFALKQYAPEALAAIDLSQVYRAHEIARKHGLPVPAFRSNVGGQAFARIGHGAFMLSEFIEGRVYGVDAMPEPAAHAMGVMLARLQKALEDLPPGVPSELWQPGQIRGYLEDLLERSSKRRDSDPVDERACILIGQKLSLLETLDRVPTYRPGWSHGDYHWRNVLFDDADQVAGIIDFDTVAYFSAARDVMRCIALSFPGLGPSAFTFFEGYASTTGLSPDQAWDYVDLYRYISSYRVWPVAARYLEPQTYDPRWDDLIHPFPDWDWAMLGERLADIAARASPRP